MSKEILEGLGSDTRDVTSSAPSAPQAAAAEASLPAPYSAPMSSGGGVSSLSTSTNSTALVMGVPVEESDTMPTPVKIPVVQTLSSRVLDSPSPIEAQRLAASSPSTNAKTKTTRPRTAASSRTSGTSRTIAAAATATTNNTNNTTTNTTTTGTRKSRKIKRKKNKSPKGKEVKGKSESGYGSSATTGGGGSRVRRISNGSTSSGGSGGSNGGAGKKKRGKKALRKDKSSSSNDSSRSGHSGNKSNVVGSQAAKAKALRLRNGGVSRHGHSVLTKTNFLIQTAEVRADPIHTLRELEQCAASMFVAIFESMFRVRLRGIVREPQRLQDYAQNAQLVIDAISSAFHVDIRHINGNLICDGHRASISTLVDVFIEILTEKVSSRRGRSRSRSEERQQFRENERSPVSGRRSRAGDGGILDVASATRRRRPTSAPPTERRATSRTPPNAQSRGDAAAAAAVAAAQHNPDAEQSGGESPLRSSLKKRRAVTGGRTKKKSGAKRTSASGRRSGGERTSSSSSALRRRKKKPSLKRGTGQPPRQHASSEAVEQQQNDWLDDDASQLVNMEEEASAASEASLSMSLSNRQNVSSQYLAAAAMAAATAALDAHASHDMVEEPDHDELLVDDDDDFETSNDHNNEDDDEEDEDKNEAAASSRAVMDPFVTVADETIVSQDDNSAEKRMGVVADTSQSPLWEAQDSTALFGANERQINFEDDDLNRVLDRIASLDTTSVAGSAIAKPLWDMLLRSGSLAAEDTEMLSSSKSGSGTSPLTRRQIRQTEIRKRHRMYKKLLKAQIKALKIEQVEEASVLSTSGEMGYGGALDSLRSSGGQPLSPSKSRIPLRSNTGMHQARVDLIRESRLKKDLRRAAKARLIRRKRREELVVDKLFTAALKDERRRLAVERAEIRRARKEEERDRQDKLLAIEHQYTEHRKMLAEQVRQRQRERHTAQRAQKMEFKSMTREIRDEKRQRFQQLIEQLDRQDQQDAESDWVSGLGAELEGPGMSGKLRALLTKFTTSKPSSPEPRAERLSWIRTRSARPAVSPTKRMSKRRARQKKVHMLKTAYGGCGGSGSGGQH